MRNIVYKVSKGCRTIGYETIESGRWYVSANGRDWEDGTYIGDNLKRWEGTPVFDINGSRVYEGDIVKTNHEIKYRKAAKRFTLVQWTSNRFKMGFNIGMSNDKACEIMGSMYENPELLAHCENYTPPKKIEVMHVE